MIQKVLHSQPIQKQFPEYIVPVQSKKKDSQTKENSISFNELLRIEKNKRQKLKERDILKD